MTEGDLLDLIVTLVRAHSVRAWRASEHTVCVMVASGQRFTIVAEEVGLRKHSMADLIVRPATNPALPRAALDASELLTAYYLQLYTEIVGLCGGSEDGLAAVRHTLHQSHEHAQRALLARYTRS